MLRSFAAASLRGINPSKLGPELRKINWDSIFRQASLDDLDDVKFSLRVILHSLEEEEKEKCRQLEEIPATVQQLLNAANYYGNQSRSNRKSLVKNAVPYVLKIVPRVKVNERLKMNVRRLLAINHFSGNVLRLQKLMSLPMTKSEMPGQLWKRSKPRSLTWKKN